MNVFEIELSSEKIKEIKERLADSRDMHNLIHDDRLAVTIDREARGIEYQVTMNGENFTASFLDWRSSTTLGPKSIQRVKELAIKLINRHDESMKMYK